MKLFGGNSFSRLSLGESISKRHRGAIITLIAAFGAGLLMAQDNVPPPDWAMFGQNAANTATSALEKSVSSSNVQSLQVKWTFQTGGDVSARAAVVDAVAYFPDWGGNLWAVNAKNGKLIWGHQLSDYGLTDPSIPATTFHSRTTPAIDGGVLYLGTQEGGWLLAINASTGNLIWKTRLEAQDPFAIITTSPVVYKGVVYTGVASLAEGGTLLGAVFSQLKTPPRGSVVAVNAATGAVIWQIHTVPVGYTGGGVWGSNPVVDGRRNLLFIGTGNNYTNAADSAPSSIPNVTYGTCISQGGSAATCDSPNDHVDSILALDLSTGALKWATKLATWPGIPNSGSDDWNVDCSFGGPQCPSNPGPDFDFGSAPNEITYQSGGGLKTIIGAGQKSGFYYALNPDTGKLLWKTQVGPGSSLGGMEWGSASDGVRIYVAIANLYGLPYAAGSAGSWAALDPNTGAIIWQKADPNGSVDIGPLAVANGVVFAPSMAGTTTAPNMFALDAATGNTLWSYAAGSSVIAGATIVNGFVYWGSGYTHLGIPGYTGGNNKFFAFSK